MYRDRSDPSSLSEARLLRQSGPTVTDKEKDKEEDKEHVLAASVQRSALSLESSMRPDGRGAEVSNSVLQLQRTFGNSYVQRFIQRKLDVSHPADPAEREAEDVADRIMSGPDPTAAGASPAAAEMPTLAPVQARLLSAAHEPASQADAGNADQAIAANGVHRDAETAVSAASNSSGQPLPERLQTRFEHALGADLSGVRVHTGPQSTNAARSISARAYTAGTDIHFNQGEYDPQSATGQRLLAHEVAHTVQQSSS